MQTNRQKSGLITGILLPMGLVCLFAFCSLALALLGGRAYKQIQQSVQQDYHATLAASYLQAKLAQNNRPGAASLREEGGLQVLVISAESEQPMETWIFIREGTLMEVTAMAGQPFNTAGAIPIAELAACRFTLQGSGLLRAHIEDEKGAVVDMAFATAQEGGNL